MCMLQWAHMGYEGVCMCILVGVLCAQLCVHVLWCECVYAMLCVYMLCEQVCLLLCDCVCMCVCECCVYSGVFALLRV